MYDKKNLEKKRFQVRKLFFKMHVNKSEIARRIAVSRPFVHKWTSNKSKSVKDDRRGWPKGKKRVYTDKEEKRVIDLRNQFENTLFTGPDKILDEYSKKYPKARNLTRSFVTRVIWEHFPMSRRKTLKAVKEQKYPINALANLGKIQQEADFMGKKYITGKSEPIHFFTRVYKKPFLLRLLKRVSDETSQTALDTLTKDWKQYPLPDTLSLDNAWGFTASGAGKCSHIISPFIQYLLFLGVTPIFIAPKKPWMNGTVEGTHSVFTRNAWNRFTCNSLSDVDKLVQLFEKEYQRLKPLPDKLPGKTLSADFSWKDVFSKSFQPKKGMYIYLIRLVQEKHLDSQIIPAIRIFKELIKLDKSLINTYVLVKLNIYKEQASMYVEPKDKDLRLVEERKFPLRFAKKKV